MVEINRSGELVFDEGPCNLYQGFQKFLMDQEEFLIAQEEISAREHAYAPFFLAGYKFCTNAVPTESLREFDNPTFALEKLVEHYRSQGFEVVVRDDAYGEDGQIVNNYKAILTRKTSTPKA